MREDGLLFGYVETPDFDQALAKMAETDVNTRWQDMMAPYFEGIGGKHADESMARLEQVFYLE
jgi:L-rhamnose mutarotase